jgi:hypothetical protein
MTGITGLTGKPPRPSSTDEQSSLAPLRPYQSSVPQPYRAIGSDCSSLRSPYRVRLAARTGRHS